MTISLPLPWRDWVCARGHTVEGLHSMALALGTLMFVSSITPGPNNVMLLASGVRFGFVRTVPLVVGVSVGLVLLLGLSYAGVAALLQAHPRLGDALSLACALYLLWLAVHALGDELPQAEAAGARPMRTHEAVLFQFVNPKAWAMAVAACALVQQTTLPACFKLGGLLLIGGLINLVCISLWALFGKALRRYLSRAQGLRCAFNGVMALLLLGTALWMILPLATTLSLAGIDPAQQAAPGLKR
jgi:threonine/homoserine/homoserine lactone efflux protein